MIRKKTRLMTSAAALIAVLAALLVAIPLMSTRSAAENVFDFVIGINDDGSLIKESKPYTSISTAEEFQKINESEENLAGNYVLERDITLPADWTPIGSESGKPFTGCFEGNEHTITIGADTTGTYMKIVPFVNNNGVIHNVKVTGTVSVNTYFGSVVSSNGSGAYVIDCSSDADITVTGPGNVGGIVGVNNGTVYRCQFTGTLATEVTDNSSWYGGIAGKNEGTVDSCANYGSIGGCVNVGGIAGQNDSNCTVKDCLNAGNISSNSSNAGGITGSNFGTISSSFTSGNVTMAEYRRGVTYGGICASNSYDGTITGTYYDRAQFPGNAIGGGDTLGYTCGVYPWEIKDVELDGWNPLQAISDSGETSKKRTVEYSLSYPGDAVTVNKSISLFRFETKDGSAWKSYTPITNANELKAIADSPDECYVLEKDIILSDNWKPICVDGGTPFKGCFDGNGYTIKGLNVNTSDGSYRGYGLFGYVAGSIVDVKVEGSVQTSSPYVGGIVGYTEGAFIKDCSFNGPVSSTNAIWVGGIVGFASDDYDSGASYIKNCSYSGSLSGISNVGGIAGTASGGTEISGCYSYGSVTADYSVSGGIVGDLTGKITDCFSSAEVSGTYNVGGIIGSVNNNPTVTNCIFAGKVNYTEGPHGGISGQEGGSYTNCYYLSGSFDSGDYDTECGTALSPVELASLTNDDLGSAWEASIVGTDLTETDSKYHIYKMECTFPKLSIMAEYVKSSAEVYNFGIDGNDDYQAFTAIKTVDDLKNIENDVTGNYVIMVDELDASGMETLCIYNDNPFSGKLAGNGCKLTLSKPLFEYNSGLVMGINAAGTIDGSSGYHYGAISRFNDGTIYGSSFSGSVNGISNIGGICGKNDESGVIRKCFNTGTVAASEEYAGGIVGLNFGLVAECYNAGSVTAPKSAGGIVGYDNDDGEIRDCLNTGRITGQEYIGGIAGYDRNATISNVLNAGVALSTADEPKNYGCISGWSDFNRTYTDCYFIAELSATNYNGFGTGISIGDIAELNLGAAWNEGVFGTLGAADSEGFKSQTVTLPSLNGVGKAQTVDVYQFNFKVNPSDEDNWQYTTRVTTLEELQNVCLSGNIALANDIVVTDSDPAFVPLRAKYDSDRENNLSGYFSGNGHTIKNLKLKQDSSTGYSALFMWSYGVIMDLTMDGSITANCKNGAAPFCYINYGTIIRCHNAADVSGSSEEVYGIAVSNYGKIINCWNSGSLTGESIAGGICHHTYGDGEIIGCYNIGALSADKICGIALAEFAEDRSKIKYSYCMSGGYWEEDFIKPAKAFSSGEIAYLLNGDQSTIAWGQEIGKDSFPVLGGMRVYVSSPCAYIYTNDNSDLHKEHVYVDGKCKNCGEYKVPSQDADGYYLLKEKSDLMWFAHIVNSGTTDINARLMADITLNENVLDENGMPVQGDYEQWEPIGTANYWYTGNFDGNGHTISGIFVREDYAGLFGFVNEARISNLTVADSMIWGFNYSGGIAGIAVDSVIENCVNSSFVTSRHTGGIVSVIERSSDTAVGGITGCVNTGTVWGTTMCAGIAFGSAFNITDCANYGVITQGNYDIPGAGIVASLQKECSVINCINVGLIYCGEVSPLVYCTYENSGDDIFDVTAANIKNSYYNKDLYVSDGSEDRSRFAEDYGKTTAELTFGNIFGNSDWTKHENDLDNKLLYYPVPASVAKNIDKSLLEVAFTSQMTFKNTDTAPVYGDTLNFTVNVEIKPEGAADFSSVNELCKSADFELYLGDVLLTADDYTITLADGTLSVAVSKTIDAGTYKFTVKGVSGFAKGIEAECAVTVGKKAFAGVITTPTAENEITCGQKLSEVKLSDAKWKWADGTIIAGDNDGFEAVLTLTDDNNYDYTGVEGYNKATHTITRKIAVTVNHQFGEWVTTKKATYISTGIKKRTCTVCGATEEDTIPKKSGGSSGGNSGSSGGGNSGSSTGGNSGTADNNPSINGKQKSWSDISSDIAKLPAESTAVINLNGETTVPSDVIRAIKNSKAKVEFVIDSTESRIVDGSKITAVSAADFSKLPVSADKSALRGVLGTELKIAGTGVPADLKLKFRKEFAGQFANLYKLTDGKPVFQSCAKIDENGAAIISGADAEGEYIVMVCEFSDRPGDMNNDGVLNALDAAAILKEAVGIERGANPQMADFNGDGKVNALDASAILKWIIAA